MRILPLKSGGAQTRFWHERMLEGTDVANK